MGFILGIGRGREGRERGGKEEGGGRGRRDRWEYSGGPEELGEGGGDGGERTRETERVRGER